MRRVAAIKERTGRIRGSADVVAGSVIVDTVGLVPPALSAVLDSVPSLPRRQRATVPNNLVVSNVPGPRLPLYFCGARVLGIHPVVPLNPADQGFNVGVFTYNGTLHSGISADRRLDPPISTVSAAFRDALEELIGLASADRNHQA